MLAKYKNNQNNRSCVKIKNHNMLWLYYCRVAVGQRLSVHTIVVGWILGRMIFKLFSFSFSGRQNVVLLLASHHTISRKHIRGEQSILPLGTFYLLCSKVREAALDDKK